MRCVIQRVLNASCKIDGVLTGEIDQGFCIFVGFTHGDDEKTVDSMVRKIIGLRIFDDGNHAMNLNIQSVQGKILSISQFTLYASCRKGNRPGFSDAMNPEPAEKLYEYFNQALAAFVPVETGVFGADMKISLVNDGPVTIVLDSSELSTKRK